MYRIAKPLSTYAVCAIVLLAAFPRAAPAAVPEYSVKAALIYKISKFVRWPDGAFDAHAGTLNLCVVGRDDFGVALDALTGKKLQGQQIAVERQVSAEQAAAKCNIAFISRSERERLPAVIAALARGHVLTVSDIDGFATAGGMVEFATVDSKISFEINPSASRRAGLDISAQLLQLATLVGEAHPETKP